MSRHKKRMMKQAEVQVPFPVLISYILIVIVVLGLSYMWLCSRCDALGKEIKQKEHELTESAKRLADEQSKWSLLTSPENLEYAIKVHRLNMVMPKEEQIVRIRYQRERQKAKLAYR